MATALAVTQQQSIESTTRSRSRIHRTDRCPRCGGLMVAEWSQYLSDSTGQRCVDIVVQVKVRSGSDHYYQAKEKP